MPTTTGRERRDWRLIVAVRPIRVLATLAAVILLGLTGLATRSEAQRPRDRPLVSPREPGAALTVYLVTMGQGDEVWTRFGHAALWIHNAARGTDITYNWGMFDFRQPHFIARFLLGDMRYSMARLDLRQMLDEYATSQRTVRAQELALTPAERVALQRFAEWNARPENRDYNYDYFRDNCSTRVRDAIDRALGGRIRAATAQSQTPATYRRNALRLVANSLPLYVGIALALGEPADRPITAWQAMFLPDQLRAEMRTIRVRSADGRMVPLVRAETVLFRSNRPPEATVPPRSWPWALVLGVAAAAVVVLFARADARRSRAARIIALMVGWLWSLTAGLTGILLLTAWTLTRHTFMYSNENLLLFSPISLVVVGALPLAFSRAGPGCRGARRTVRAGATLGAILAVGALGVKLLPGRHQENWTFMALALPMHLALLAVFGNDRLLQSFALFGSREAADTVWPHPHSRPCGALRATVRAVRRGRIRGNILSVLVLITVASALACSRAPQIDGHSVDYWERALKNPDPNVRMVAAQRFVATARPSPATAQVLMSALASESNHTVHVTIAQALGSLGPAAAGSVPELTRLLRDEHADVRQAAAEALGNLGPVAAAAVPALATATTDHDHDVRVAAVDALGKTGPPARAAVPALAAAVHDPISYVRLEAVTALIQIDPSNSIVQTALIHALDDSQEDVRLAACQGIRTAIRVAIRAGIRRESAADANVRLAERTGNIVAALQRAKDDPDTPVRSCAATTILHDGR